MAMEVARVRFLLRHGPRTYWADGRRLFRELQQYLEEAQRHGTGVGRVAFDARIGDWAAEHPVAKTVYEVSFAAEMVRRWQPQRVCDVGSNLVYLATLSSFVPVVSVDARAVGLRKPGLMVRHLDARALPFGDNELEFVSSLCVVEHIGLGRYGDAVDPAGDRKFVAEVRRCLRPGGVFVVSVPVSRTPVLVFNAHRQYSLAQVEDLITGFSVAEESFIVPQVGFVDRGEALAALERRRADDYMVWIGALVRQ